MEWGTLLCVDLDPVMEIPPSSGWASLSGTLLLGPSICPGAWRWTVWPLYDLFLILRAQTPTA